MQQSDRAKVSITDKYGGDCPGIKLAHDGFGKRSAALKIKKAAPLRGGFLSGGLSGDEGQF
jgi:hypothetical protein